MQVGFIDSICYPVYETFTRVSPKLSPLLEGVKTNRANWLKKIEEQNSQEKQNEDEQCPHEGGNFLRT